MANVTLRIDDETLKEARIIAAQKGTTVNALFRDYLEDMTSQKRKREMALARIKELVEEAQWKPEGKWTREELYER